MTKRYVHSVSHSLYLLQRGLITLYPRQNRGESCVLVDYPPTPWTMNTYSNGDNDGCAGKPAPTIRDLYPNLSPNELAEAEKNLEAYLQIALRIFERLEAEKNRY